MFRLHLFLFVVVSLFINPWSRAQGSCGLRKEFPPTSIRYESKSWQATLFGFDEFTAPSTPPKKYWRKELSGSLVECVYTSRNRTCGAGASSVIEWTGNFSSYGITFDYVVSASNLRFEEGFQGGRWRFDYLVRLTSRGQSGWNSGQTGQFAELKFSDGSGSISAYCTIPPFGQATPADVINSGTHTLPASLTATSPVIVTAQAGAGGYLPAKSLISVISTKKTYDGACFFNAANTVTPVVEGREITTHTTGSCSGGEGPATIIDTCTAVTPAVGLTTTVTRTEPDNNGQIESQTKTQTSTGECLSGPSGFDKKITCDRTETLTDEDTEEEAMARATVATLGTSAEAIRELRSANDFTFIFSEFTAYATFRSCPGSHLVTFHHARRQLNNPNADWENLESHHEFVQSTEPEFTVSMKVPIPASGYVHKITKITAEPTSCSNATGGSGSGTLGSVHSQLTLGQIDATRSAGLLLIDRNLIDATLYTPAALKYVGPSDPAVTVLRNSNDHLRQVKAPTLLADIVPLAAPAEGFDVRFYHAAQVEAADPLTGLFALSGSPFVTHRYDNPDVGPSVGVARLRATETRPSSTKTLLYAHDTTSGVWSLAEGDGLRLVEETIRTEPNKDVTKTRTLKTAAGQVASVTATTLRAFPWGEETILEVRDPAHAALTTTWTYYTNELADGPNYRRLKQRLDPSGYWETYTYDSQGSIASTTVPHLNAAPGAPASQCRVTTVNRSPLPDADGDGQNERMTRTTETLLGHEVSRSYEIEWTALVALSGDLCKRVTTIRCASAGATWNDPANLVTESLRHADGPFKGRLRRELLPDGTATLVSYALDPTTGELTTSSSSGVPSTALDAILDGERHVSVANIHGNVVSEEHHHLDAAHPSPGLFVQGSTATDFDSFGRPTRINYADGTFELKSYACCGLASETDRTGATTTYQYDSLGRLEFHTRAGQTTRYTYDAAGRQLKTIRIGSDNSEVTIAENIYDTAGRLVESKDALGRATTTSYQNLSGGGTLVTTTTPGGAVVRQTTAADGQLLKVEGNATPWRTYAYAVNADGTRSTTEYTPVASLAETTSWRRTLTDFLGRTVSETSPDDDAPGGLAVTSLFYDPVGRLVRQTDPDGVQTLHAYEPATATTPERQITALDVNRDGVIDYAGVDRVTRRTSTYTTRLVGSVTLPVRRSFTEVWETTGADTPATVSTTDTTLDGLQTWQTSRGLTTHRATTYAASAGSVTATTVTTSPDGTTQTEVVIDGRQSSVVVAHPTLGTLSTTTYDYDPHGRLRHVHAATGTTTYAYFADDQIQSVTTPDPDPARSGPGYDAQTTTYRYDSAGRVDRITHPDTTETFTTYTPAGQVERTWGARTYPQAYTYDAQQRLQTLTTWQDYATQAGAAVTTWLYHPQTGRLLQKRDAAGVGASYSYTPAGRLLTRTWARTVASAALVTTFGYSDAGDLATIDYSDTTPDITHTYDRLGRLATTTDAAGLLTRTYENGRLDDEVYTSAGSGLNLLAGQQILRAQDALQRVSSLGVGHLSSGIPGIGYGYDAVSRLQTITQGPRVATQGYHATRGHPDTLALTASGVARGTRTTTLDNLGRIASVATPGLASAAYDYNAANQRVRATREDGAYWDYGYDELGQVVSAAKRHADTTPRPGHAYAYEFDDIGNRLATTHNGLEAFYSANPRNQYLGRSTPALVPVLGTASPAATVKVNGETAANRVGDWFYHELALDGAGTAGYYQFPVSATQLQGTPPTSELVRSETRQTFVPASPETFVHDADGNLTQDGRWDYTWDAENRLVALETRPEVALASGLPRAKLAFAYDAQGRRIRKQVFVWNGSTYAVSADTRFLYDGWNLLAEIDAQAGNAVLRSYAWGLDLSGSAQGAGGVGGLLWASAGGANYAPAYDGNGNIIAWVDLATGVKVAENDYDAFGDVIKVSGTNPVPFGFSTKYTDSETDLVYYGLRYYNPGTGRWLSRDPIEENGGLNLYGMVGNNPVNLFDLWGLAPCEVVLFIGHNGDVYRAAQAFGKSSCSAVGAIACKLKDDEGASDVNEGLARDGFTVIDGLPGVLPSFYRNYTEDDAPNQRTKEAGDLLYGEENNPVSGISFRRPYTIPIPLWENERSIQRRQILLLRGILLAAKKHAEKLADTAKCKCVDGVLLQVRFVNDGKNGVLELKQFTRDVGGFLGGFTVDDDANTITITIQPKAKK